MYKLPAIILTTGLMLVFSGTADAELIAEEGFGYDTGNLGGQSGGQGWNAVWG